MYIYVEEELNKRGNYGDSYDDGDNARDSEYKIREVEFEMLRDLLGDYRIEKTDEGEMNYMLLHVGDTMDQDE